MSLTYKDESGVVFIFNSDLSGDVTLRVPSGPKSHHTVEIPADALSRFICTHFFDFEEISAYLDKMRSWFNKHTNAVTQYRGERAGAVAYAEQHSYKFEIGDPVFLTFSEAQGETGVVTDVGFHKRDSDGGRYEYADVKMDTGEEQTGPMPVTCICHRKDMPR